jgi:hypothetical protein
MLRPMDEGLPIAYEVLERHVAVYAVDGTRVGSVDHVVAAESLDIFHGIVIDTADGTRFVPADQVGELHERGVDLEIDAGAVAALPAPNGGAPAWRVHEPGAPPSAWRHFLGRFTPNGDRSGWTREH